MNKKLRFILKLDIFCAVILFLMMIWIEHKDAYGMAAMTSLGQFIVCLLLFVLTIIVLVVIAIVQLVKYMKKRRIKNN